MKRTIAYIDGFNLYYGALKGTPYKWLDLRKLCQGLLDQTHQIDAIKYYTALINARSNDPTQPQRQQVYLRAIGTDPLVKVVLGHFLQHEVVRPLASDPETYVRVIKTEEKGSDVNLATDLVHDAHRGLFDAALVISNDSDLKEPVRIVRRELGLIVGVVNPGSGRASRVLTQDATFVKTIRSGLLRDSLLPGRLTDDRGTISRPANW
ncbi:MAG: NYN domain-containing protein [Rhodothermales bacterium]